MRGWCWLTIGLLGGCDLYEPGALLKEPRASWAHGRTVGCVDVSIEAFLDPRVPPSSVVLDLRLGNRCERPVPIDLSKLVVTAQWPGDRAPQPLEAFDPRHEISERPLPIRQTAHEGIQFSPRTNPPAEPPSRVCVLFGKIFPGHEEPPEICYERVRQSMVPIDQEPHG